MSNENIQRLICGLIVCVEENLTGEYDIPAIVIKVQQNVQLVHADYCFSERNFEYSTPKT